MITKVILLEGSGDLTFINWLITKADINLLENTKIIEVGGKPNFKPYIKNYIISCVYDEKNQVNYDDIEVNRVLLIKDFDLDDNANAFDIERKDLQDLGINFDTYYISGTEPAPRTLETLFIENDGELLREFVKLIKAFNQQRKDVGKDYFENLNDKFLFHEFFRFVGKKSKFSAEFFDDVFSDGSFKEFIDIINLVDRIKRFIKE